MAYFHSERTRDLLPSNLRWPKIPLCILNKHWEWYYTKDDIVESHVVLYMNTVGFDIILVDDNAQPYRAWWFSKERRYSPDGLANLNFQISTTSSFSSILRRSHFKYANLSEIHAHSRNRIYKELEPIATETDNLSYFYYYITMWDGNDDILKQFFFSHNHVC